MRLTLTRADVLNAKVVRCRRTITNLKNDVRSMIPVARGGDLTALHDLRPLVVAAEAALETLEAATDALLAREARKKAVKA
jgi:hypothetical protein